MGLDQVLKTIRGGGTGIDFEGGGQLFVNVERTQLRRVSVGVFKNPCRELLANLEMVVVEKNDISECPYNFWS